MFDNASFNNIFQNNITTIASVNKAIKIKMKKYK